MNPTIKFADTTLRDGEQTPGVAFTHQEKVHIAAMLDELGIWEIDCGIPAMGKSETEPIKELVGLKLKSRLITWNRAVISDIRRSMDCGIDSVAISVPVSDFHIRYKLEKDRQWVLERIADAVTFAKSQKLYVCLGTEDATRADSSFLRQVVQLAQELDVDRIRFSDTLGVMTPFKMYDAISSMLQFCNLPIEIHTHNDYGLAGANLLAGLEAGAEIAGVSILALGERAGNASLEQTILSVEHLLRVKTGLNLNVIPKLCAYTAKAAGRFIPPGQPIVGSKVFSHESEIHAAGVIKNSGSYEPYPPEVLGLARDVPIGKHSGKSSLSHTLDRLSIKTDEHRLNMLIDKIREIAPLIKRNLTDAELLHLWQSISDSPS